jgi:hypothetical protein
MDEQTGEEYARDLGSLLMNFQALEYLLRAYLYEHEGTAFDELPAGVDWYSVKPGDELPLNALTSFESLGQLIDRYNGMVAGRVPQDAVDRSVVELRDALAHGRVSGAPGSARPVLLKFDRPTNGRVRVTVSQPLTEEWLIEQRVRIHDEAEKVFRRRNLDLQ